MAPSGQPAGASFDAIVLGAGAAGLFCAALAGERGRRVLILDHAPRAGRKILISGGGRANFTNLNSGIENFLSENPLFARSALARYPPPAFVGLVEQYGIAYHEKGPGQLFCDGSAAQIVDMLLDLCARARVELRLHTSIRKVDCVDGEYRIRCGLPGGAAGLVTAPALIVATGGLSIPKLGASGLGYELARQFGLRVVEPRPALVPLLFNREDRARFEGLSGVAAEVVAEAGGGVFRDKMLITHRGLSGPAILQVSSYWRPGMALTLDLAPDREVAAPLLAHGARRDASTLATAWQAVLPRRLAERLLAVASPENLRTAALQAAEHTLHHWRLTPSGDEGYEKAEVTAGGVSTEDLSARTMEARRQPGLYFLGEVVDVTGQLGGHNFQWAWASAAAAAEAL